MHRFLASAAFAAAVLAACSSSDPAPGCPPGFTDCAGVCAALRIDPDHCGACGDACGPSQVCRDSSCATVCPAGQVLCGATCTAPASDRLNCGRCGNACPDGQVCAGGACTISCPPGLALCGGGCVQTSIDPAHCGACDVPCGQDQVCRDGACASPCPAGQTLCSGACVSLATDLLNCGACGRACGAGRYCVAGACVDACPPGAVACAGGCVNPLSDAAHCGGCDRPCPDGQACSAGTCAVSCQANLRAGITDPWGVAWDGLERTPASLGSASAACAAFGGRLPTATELFRVSAPQSGAVGQTYMTSYLWTAIARAPDVQFMTRLSDGAITSGATASGTAFRCVCPPPTPDAFSGANCHGPAGAPCHPLDGGTSVDALDRAPLSVGGALQECALARGRLAEWRDLAERLPGGVPNGSGAWLHTADGARYDASIVVRWTSGAAWSADSSNTSLGLTTDFRPFRCVGPSTIPAALIVPTGSFVPVTMGPATDSTDLPAGQWAAVHDVCTSRGGHLPRLAELGAFVQQGLGGGSNAFLWTSDLEGYNGVQFLAGNLRWTGSAPALAFSYPTDLTWAYQMGGVTPMPHRCVYYPAAAGFVSPASCQGGCFQVQLSAVNSMWMDSLDRTPATLGAALATCAGLGGHLPMVRDFVEMVRRGLPGGSTNYLWTADLGVGNGGSPYAHVVRWTSVQTAFDGSYSSYLTWFALGSTTQPYRCLWTSEVR